MKQSSLFDKTAQQKFDEFHAKNPHILEALIRLTDQAVAKGHKRIGIALIFNVLRWETMVSTTTGDKYKLSNNYQPLYARLIGEVRPDLEKVFVKHTLKS